MRKLFGALVALCMYLCIASALSAAGGAAYLYATGKLDRAKLGKIVAVVQGIDIAVVSAPSEKKADKDVPQPSYEDRQQARSLQMRQLEMREQGVKGELDLVKNERSKLTEERSRYDGIRNAFKEELEGLRTGALSSGRENVRSIWENIKPKQAKEQILQMVTAEEMPEVVAILSAMPVNKRAKIVSEFKLPEEVAKLDEIMRMIRKGVAEVSVIDKAEKKINQP